MAKTYRKYPEIMEARRKQQAHPRASLRRPRTWSQLKAQAEVNDLSKELEEEFGVRLRNRDSGRPIANEWDDDPVSCLNETKHIWKAS